MGMQPDFHHGLLECVARWLVAATVLAVPSLRAEPLLEPERQETVAPSRLTFNRDIAPIVFSRCSSCHRPGGGGPFSLLTYDDVRRRAKQIATVTRSRYMPPWKPEAGYGEFAGTDD